MFGTLSTVVVVVLSLFSQLVSSQTLTFGVIGDWGWGPDSDISLLSASNKAQQPEKFLGQQAVAAALGNACKKVKCSFIISTGDNFYDLGISSDTGVYDPQWDSSFNDVYNASTLQRIKFYSSLGNHDYGKSTSFSNHSIVPQLEYTFFDPNQRWYLPARYYSVRPNFRLKVQITVVDSSPFLNSYCLVNTSKYYTPELLYNCKVPQRDAVLEFAKRELQAARQDKLWSIVLGHHPLISNSDGAYHPYNDLLSAVLNDTTTRPQIYLNGHDHILAKLNHPLVKKTNFFTIGSSGSIESSPIVPDPLFDFAVAEFGFAIVTLSKNTGRITWYSVNSTDSSTWTKPTVVKTYNFSKNV